MEDDLLISLVQSSKFVNYGRMQWELIAKELNNKIHFNDSYLRLSKHCRERWVNHLNPEMKRDRWSMKEDIELFERYLEFPQKWSKISKILRGRTDNSIKNRFNKLIKLEKLKKSLYEKDPDEEQFEKLKNIFILAKDSIDKLFDQHSSKEKIQEKIEEKKEEEKVFEMNEKKRIIEPPKETEKIKEIVEKDTKVDMKLQNFKRNLPLFVRYEEEFKWRRFLNEIGEINIYAKHDYFYC